MNTRVDLFKELLHIRGATSCGWSRKSSFSKGTSFEARAKARRRPQRAFIAGLPATVRESPILATPEVTGVHRSPDCSPSCWAMRGSRIVVCRLANRACFRTREFDLRQLGTRSRAQVDHGRSQQMAGRARQRCAMRFHDGFTRVREYNEASDVVRFTDENGSVMENTFDALGRLVRPDCRSRISVGRDPQCHSWPRQTEDGLGLLRRLLTAGFLFRGRFFRDRLLRAAAFCFAGRGTFGGSIGEELHGLIEG
jgi:YD repeat-containing protein